MSDCKPYSMPLNTQANISSDMRAPVNGPTGYYSLAGTLQYLTFIRPDIAYAVQQVCLHMHDPREPHLTTAKCIIRYLQGTLDHGLLFHRTSTSGLIVYSDADWTDCLDTHRSTLGYGVFMGDNLVSCSSTEAEYHAVANGVVEACWLCQLLVELYNPLSRATLVYCNNVSTVYLSTNPIQHQHTKHVEIDLHFVCVCVGVRDVRVIHVPMTSQFTDIFTKGLPEKFTDILTMGLPSSVFFEFRSSLNICSG
jgi:hypothetical protein